MKTFIEKVSYIQGTLKAPKSQFNAFGKYAYRNAEDILEAVKPLLKETGLVLTITDEVIFNPGGGEAYIKAVATITDGKETISNSALAREAGEQKGMNPAQITGSTSSYARKYALNGLFLIDDTKDADATNTHGKDTEEKSVPTQRVASVAEKATVSAPAKRSGGWGNRKTNASTTTPAVNGAGLKGDLY
jgi:ERF superfamily